MIDQIIIESIHHGVSCQMPKELGWPPAMGEAEGALQEPHTGLPGTWSTEVAGRRTELCSKDWEHPKDNMVTKDPIEMLLKERTR